MRWLNSITNSMDMNVYKLQEIVEDIGTWHAAVHGLQRVGHSLVTEQQQKNRFWYSRLTRQKGTLLFSFSSQSNKLWLPIIYRYDVYISHIYMYIYMYISLYICIYISYIHASDSGGISISLSSFFPLGSQILHISETLIKQVFNNQGAS